MKKVLLNLIVAFTISYTCYGQNVAINASGAAPHASAMLDVSATNKGLLIPRMASTQRTKIPSPAIGLQVFDTDTKTFWFYNGTVWKELAAGSGANFWTLNGTNIYKNNTGNVGIGLTVPLAPLHIKNEAEALRIQGTKPFISFYDNSNTLKGFLQSYNNDLYLGTPSTNTNGSLQFYTVNNPVMTILSNGNVGIGTTNPFGRLQIGESDNSAGFDFYIGKLSQGLGLYQGGSSSLLQSTTDIVLSSRNGNGYIGINTTSPKNHLQIGSVGASNFATNDLAIGNGNAAMAIQQTDASTLMGSTTDIVFRPRNNNAGNVGINVLTPTNKLQIGSVGATGFATNDFAIGNGTAAMAIQQTNTSTLIGSTTDIVLRPRNNGFGRVGINTNTPRAPLDVTDLAGVAGINKFYAFVNQTSGINGGTVGTSSSDPVPQVSIIAAGRVYAFEFDAYSDARIKTVVGISNSESDLATINAIKITDYTMKDKVKYGDKPFKKVIAQEVEKVYPQVVFKHADFVPNIYQVTSNVQKTANGYLLTFAKEHTISSTAKKLRVLLAESQGMEECEIVSVVNNKQVEVRSDIIKGDKVFVYGEEVDDFRTVDYEGLTTLNISATQELSKRLEVQEAAIAEQNKKIAELTEAVKSLTGKKLTLLLAKQ